MPEYNHTQLERTHLDLKVVGDIAGCFEVPAYQRGYRWGTEDVELLLEDITENGDKEYCLQPIVVKPQTPKRYELIDGQQRLTTLYLIFLCMKKKQLKNPAPRFSIIYQTRPSSAHYLLHLDEARKNDNIDFCHMYNAYQCIWKWLEAKSNQQLAADDVYRYSRSTATKCWKARCGSGYKRLSGRCAENWASRSYPAFCRENMSICSWKSRRILQSGTGRWRNGSASGGPRARPRDSNAESDQLIVRWHFEARELRTLELKAGHASSSPVSFVAAALA